MRRSLVAWAILVATAGCAQPETGIGRQASSVLAPQVAAIRSAADAQDRSQVAQRLTTLRQSVSELTEGGRLSQEAARRILDAAAEVEDNLQLIPSRQPAPVRRQSPPPAQAPSPPAATPTIPPPPTDQPTPVEQPTPAQTGEEGDAGEGGENGGGKGPGSDEQVNSGPQGSSSGNQDADGVSIIGATEEVGGT